MQMPLPFPGYLLPLFGGAAAVGGAVVVLAWRVREQQRPVTARSILIPPLGMSTGFSMFLVPIFRVPWTWALVAFLVGFLVLSIPLTRTSRLTRVGDTIMLRRSRAFLAVLVGLVLLRLALRGYVEHLVSHTQTAGLFFILAFGMIVRWRLGMYLEYRRLVRR
jgi:membrane protein CcdC involved in cytochrome C biogenesis